MESSRSINYLTFIFIISQYTLFAQQTSNTNLSNFNTQTTNNNKNNFNQKINNNDLPTLNPTVDNNALPVQQQMFNLQIQTQETNKNIEPTLDNGFHIRFQVESLSASSHLDKISKNNFKAKKNKTTFAKRNFIRKKRFRNLFPKRKIKYKTSLCSQF